MQDHSFAGTPIAQLTTATIQELLSDDQGFFDTMTGAPLSTADYNAVIDRLRLELEIRSMGLR
jgi:hypothetical protein